VEDTSGRFAAHYKAAVSEMVRAVASGDKGQLMAARAQMADAISDTMAMGEIFGAMQILRAASTEMVEMKFGADARELLSFAAETPLTIYTLQEAIDDMVSRTPYTLRKSAERTAQNIAKLYSEDRVTAFVRSAEKAVTAQVQDVFLQAMKDGTHENRIGPMVRAAVDKVSKATAAWTDTYSRMAFRTNVNTSVTAGRFRQATDPAVAAVIPAFRFDAMGDADTRHNHMLLDGRIFKTNNPVWNKIAPPIDYNCRCQVTLVSAPQLERMGRMLDGDTIESSFPSSYRPSPTFRHTGRPDLFMVP
jgi:SPP1 gp7 family putative phage head morphogenesis protein